MATFLALIEFGSVYQGNWEIAFKFLSNNETANQNWEFHSVFKSIWVIIIEQLHRGVLKLFMLFLIM